MIINIMLSKRMSKKGEKRFLPKLFYYSNI